MDNSAAVRAIVRATMVVTGAAAAVITYGFFAQAPWAKALWPWAEGRLTYIFIASIAAAIAAPNLWIGASGKLFAIAPGALNLGVSHLAIAGFLFSVDGSADRVVLTAAAMLLLGVVEMVAFLWAARVSVLDARPTPLPVRASFGVFTGVLVATGFFLVTGSPHIFPWPLKPEGSVIMGWIFWGAALYFGAGVVRPVWENACGQLLGFLAYDLVLIGPYVAHFDKVKPAHALSLKVYVAVISYSALLAVYYLFVHAETRFRGKVRVRGPAKPATTSA
jgi:hypothetical protein